jgi:hypothetical protein
MAGAQKASAGGGTLERGCDWGQGCGCRSSSTVTCKLRRGNAKFAAVLRTPGVEAK